MKENRYIALLYAKLLLTVIHLQITHCLQKTLLHEKSGKIRMLSLNKKKTGFKIRENKKHE
jgi:hypothetical protein